MSLGHCLVQMLGMDFQVPGCEAVTLTFMLNSRLAGVGGVLCSPGMFQDPEDKSWFRIEQQLGNIWGYTCEKASGAFVCWRQPTIQLPQRQCFHKSRILPFSLTGDTDP